MGLSSQLQYNKIRVLEPSFLQATLTSFLDKCINGTLKRNEASKVSS